MSALWSSLFFRGNRLLWVFHVVLSKDLMSCFTHCNKFNSAMTLIHTQPPTLSHSACFLSKVLLISRSDFLVTFPPPLSHFFPLFKPPVFISLDVPFVLLHSLYHFTHHEWIVRLSTSCLCTSSSPSSTMALENRQEKKNRENVFSQLLKAATRALPSFSMSEEN